MGESPAALPSSGLDKLFSPSSLAVVGASSVPTKWGHKALTNIVAAGFEGRVYAVNSRAQGDSIAGAPAYARVSDIEEGVDCALLAVPAAAVEQAIGDCVDARVGAAIITAAGFGEVSAEGRQVEAALTASAAEAGLRLVGPNCFGLYRPSANLVLTPFQDFSPGSVAVVSQSGNLAVALAGLARRAGLGFSACVGVGNQVDIGFGELLAYFAADDQTKAVGLYVEGLREGRGDDFLRGLDACAAAGKLVAVIKAGVSQAGSSVAETHTGALATDDRTWDEVLGRHGAVRVRSPEAMMDALAVAARLPGPRSNVAVVSDGGGDGVMAADALDRSPLRLAELSGATRQQLAELRPESAPVAPGLNPLVIDTPGGAEDDPGLIARCSEVLAADDGVDVVAVVGVLGGYYDRREQEMAAARTLARLASEGRRLVVHSAYDHVGEPAVEHLRDAGVPIFPTVDRLIAALGAGAPPRPPSAAPRVAATVLETPTVARLLDQAGVRVPPVEVVRSPAELEAVLLWIGFPACIKLESSAVAHKSDVAAVRTGLSSQAEAMAAAETIWARFPDDPLLVMPSFPPGLELLVGAFTDRTFGSGVIVGRGGIWTELEADTILVVQPSGPEQILHALPRLRMWPMLSGGRGQAAMDIEALAELAYRVHALAQRDAGLTLEVNPVLLYADGYQLADMRAHLGGA